MQQHIVNHTLNVTLEGRFTFSDNGEFRKVLEAINDPGVQRIVLHMEKVEFIDSAALGMLLLAEEEASRLNKALAISGAHGQVKRIFTMARFNEIFTFI